jgi:hypothetical protein
VKRAKEDPEYTSFLSHFGEFKSVDVHKSAVGLNDLLLDRIEEIRKNSEDNREIVSILRKSSFFNNLISFMDAQRRGAVMTQTLHLSGKTAGQGGTQPPIFMSISFRLGQLTEDGVRHLCEEIRNEAGVERVALYENLHGYMIRVFGKEDIINFMNIRRLIPTSFVVE